MKPNGPPISARPEEDLLLCCSRVYVDSGTSERIKGLLERRMDWLYLSQLALRHGVMPLLYRNLKSTCAEAIPANVLDQLRKYFLANACRNLFLGEELLKLLRVFEDHGISAVPYKGPAMAASIYGDITLRQFCDLDIFVQKKDLSGARQVLISQGYRPVLHFHNTAEEEMYFQSPFKRSLHFVRDDGKVPVDLHWGIESKYLSFGLGADLHEHLERTFLDRCPINTIEAEYLMFLLCIHGAQHSWAKINWICDVAELIRRRGDIEWGQIIDHSRILGIHRMVSCGFLLTAWLLEIELQEEVLRDIKADPSVQLIAEQVVRKLFQRNGDGVGRFERELFYLKMMERIEDKARFCFNLVMRPTHAEWSIIPLSKPFYSLYYLLRPIRLAGKYTQKVFYQFK